MSEININLLAYLFTQMHPETRFNPETVASISPCFSFAENGPKFCKCIVLARSAKQ